MKNKYIYCTNCGTKNSNKDKVCKKCKKKLEVKNHLFRDFVYNHTKDKIKSDITDNIFSLISRFLISHLYGVFFAATIVFTGVSAISFVIDTNSKVYTKAKQASVVETSCHKVNSVNSVSVCSEGYELINDKCLKEYTINAKEKNICEDGYYLKGNRCVSNKTYTSYEKQCIVTDETARQVGFSNKNNKDILGSKVNDNLCFMSICSEWIEGVCQSGYNEEINFTSVPVCSRGTTLIDNQCRISKSPNKEYTCESGKLDNNKCVITEETEPTPSCEEGYVFNKECNVCEVE